MLNIINNKKGITLIALVISIIILLILAGVSIATLAGNNGLISRTILAKNATRAGEVKELVRLEAQANKIAETTNDTQKTRSAVIAELVSDGKLTSAEAEEIQSAESPVITIGEITIDFSVLPENSTSPIATFGETNTTYSRQFGKLVTGYSPASGSNWRLFYADSNYAYLISDMVESNYISRLPGYGTSTISEVGKSLNPKYLYWTENANNTNIKAVATLLDTTKWNDYKTSDAEWAVGAPSLELFVASYNATHNATNYSALGVKNIQLTCTVESSASTGYKVVTNQIEGILTNNENTISGLSNNADFEKAIYFPDIDNYIWLSSPASEGSDDNTKVYFLRNIEGDNGAITCTPPWSNLGIRPIACVPISKIGNGIIITSSY